MDIKLKKYKNRAVLKTVLSTLCIFSFLGCILAGIMGLYQIQHSGISDFRDIMRNAKYETSDSFSRDINSIMHELTQMSRIKQAIAEYKTNKPVDVEQLQQSGILNNYQFIYDDYGAVNSDKVYLTEDDVAILEEQYTELADDLKKNGNPYYYVKVDDVFISSNPDYEKMSMVEARLEAKNHPAYFMYEKGNFHKMPESQYGYYYIGGYDSNMVAYIGFPQDYLSGKQEILSGLRGEVLIPFTCALGLALLSLITFIWSMVITGRRDEEGKPVLNFVDKIYTEVQLVIAGTLLVGGGAFFINMLYESFFNTQSYLDTSYINTLDPWFLCLSFLVGVPCAAVGLELILSMVRNLKYKRFLRNSLIYKLCVPFKEMIVEFLHGGTIMRRLLLATGGIALLAIFIMMIPMAMFYYLDFGMVILACLVTFILLGIGSRWMLPHVKQYEEIKKGVERVKAGDLSYKIPVKERSELGQLAAGINNISEGFDIAVQGEMRNQRLKTELISNVSHDIKTPLTSIITYTDLLKNEGVGSEDAKEYLEILAQKSFRLKKLTEDLFDAAKASSGAITVDLEEVELLSLLNQGLGEMSSDIEKAGLTFKINADLDKYYVVADGQLLWRVIENLLSNVLKYAQENTRVYVDLTEDNESTTVAIKNISKQELNIKEEELMERFKRGDESRTTEGSGLGLSIARDLVKVQNGFFSINIDGDLFKAIVTLQRSK